MAPKSAVSEPITIRADDLAAAERMAEALRRLQLRGDQQGATMTTADGQRVDLAPFLVGALRQLASLLAQGDDVALVPVHHDISLADATMLLNVSRSSLISLLDAGEMPAWGSGDDRRIPLRQVVAYNARRHARNRSDLAAALQIVQEAGAYD